VGIPETRLLSVLPWERGRDEPARSQAARAARAEKGQRHHRTVQLSCAGLVGFVRARVSQRPSGFVRRVFEESGFCKRLEPFGCDLLPALRLLLRHSGNEQFCHSRSGSRNNRLAWATHSRVPNSSARQSAIWPHRARETRRAGGWQHVRNIRFAPEIIRNSRGFPHTAFGSRPRQVRLLVCVTLGILCGSRYKFNSLL